MDLLKDTNTSPAADIGQEVRCLWKQNNSLVTKEDPEATLQTRILVRIYVAIPFICTVFHLRALILAISGSIYKYYPGMMGREVKQANPSQVTVQQMTII